MAIKVSDLPVATVVDNEDYLMVVQNGISKKATANKVKTPITVHDSYDTSSVEPYSANYINNIIPTNYVSSDRIKGEYVEQGAGMYIYNALYVNELADEIRESIPIIYILNEFSESTTNTYSCSYINTQITNIMNVFDDYLPTDAVYNTYNALGTGVYTTGYINNLVGDIDTVLTTLTTGGGV